MSEAFSIRDAKPEEFDQVGQLMVQVYSSLPGFPSPQEQPTYYEMLANVGKMSDKSRTRLLVAINDENEIAGAVVYIGDMQHYGSGGSATREKNAAGFRLLAVDPAFRGNSLGKLLTRYCITLAKEEGLQQMVIHTTEAMKTAWGMYERMDFQRSTDLDFEQKGFPVFGFRLQLS